MSKNYNNLINKILEIIKEDENQPEFLLKHDLNKLLNLEIGDIEQDAYNSGYEQGLSDRESWR